MKQKWTGPQLSEAVRRFNAMAAGMKKTLPLVRAELDGARITGNKVDKKTRRNIDAIIKANMPGEAWARCYLSTQYEYTVYLNADFNAPDGEHTCNYADLSRAVASKKELNWAACVQDALPEVTEKSVIDAINAAEKAGREALEAGSRASDAKTAAMPFVD